VNSAAQEVATLAKTVFVSLPIPAIVKDVALSEIGSIRAKQLKPVSTFLQ
jgi:hypothetical protein